MDDGTLVLIAMFTCTVG